jgi:hypothetical protein
MGWLMDKLHRIFGGTTDRRHRMAMRKRAMERRLREQGHSAGYARAVVSRRFTRTV